MRIALISYEFPPSVTVGGIGAYTWQAAKGLSSAGHTVEVFAAGEPSKEPAAEFNIHVERVTAANRKEFGAAILGRFAERHSMNRFDILESPEIGAEGKLVAETHPEIARVIKLHTPTYLINQLSWEPPSPLARVRFGLGALRRGRWDWLQPEPYDRSKDREYRWARMADEIAAPCVAIAEKVKEDWSLSPDRISTFPLPYEPHSDLLNLAIPESAETIGFLGRLEPRKGILELMEAIGVILKVYPKISFRFLGPSWPYRGSDMETWIKKAYPNLLQSIGFRGAIRRQDLAHELAACDVVVLPSRWENFPFACWESMAAGRAVIGSAAGGMADVIGDGISGLLVQPRSPEDIAKKILSLIGKPDKVRKLASAGRARVQNNLDPKQVIKFQIASYQRAIDRVKVREDETI